MSRRGFRIQRSVGAELHRPRRILISKVRGGRVVLVEIIEVYWNCGLYFFCENYWGLGWSLVGVYVWLKLLEWGDYVGV